MWSPWIAAVIMSLWLLLSLAHCSGGNLYIYILRSNYNLKLPCNSFFIFSIFAFATPPLGRHTVTAFPIMATLSRVSGVARAGVWLLVLAAAARASGRGRERDVCDRGENDGKLTVFRLRPWDYYKRSIFLPASVWWCTAQPTLSGLWEHMVHFQRRDEKLKRKEKKMMWI